MTLGTIYADLGMTDKDEKAEVYVDGVLASELAKVSKGNDAKIADLKFAGTDKCSVGNGTLVEAYLDEDTNDVTIACINTYVAEVNKVVAASRQQGRLHHPERHHQRGQDARQVLSQRRV